ncbi:MAG TPA: hypothetical protein VKA15_03745 [Isosphaeraceae bacterium]|nr:hypothetical protein [Isosphaeraceae bacterium]
MTALLTPGIQHLIAGLAGIAAFACLAAFTSLSPMLAYTGIGTVVGVLLGSSAVSAGVSAVTSPAPTASTPTVPTAPH